MRKASNKSNANKSKSKSGATSFENMKYEIANEFGVNLGADATSRANGTVGGEITKRLVDKGKNKMGGNNKNSN